MRVIFVTPSEVSSGEAITALHTAENVRVNGGEVRFLSSAFTARLLKDSFPEEVTEFTPDAKTNAEIWESSLNQFRPHAVVFADYPLLFFSNGTAPLADDAWVHKLEETDAVLVTLDHLGYAQRPMSVYFGPPHLSMHCERTPELPKRMRILLPCPLNEPSKVEARIGTPFRCWHSPPRLSEDQRRATRALYSRDDGDLLIFHSAAGWAARFANRMQLPHYRFLTDMLEHYLSTLERRVTLVSVNNGNLLASSNHENIRVHNLAPLTKDEFERLLFACDLVITENSISQTLGKAVCGLTPAAVLLNSYSLPELLAGTEEWLRELLSKLEGIKLGSIFPYEVFPIWRREDVEDLGLFEQNSFAEAFARLELFGGEATREQFAQLLLDEQTRADLRSRQETYVNRLSNLDDAYSVLQTLN
jgi:hypothetical protein